jgi:hypothetical protein
MHPKHSSEIMIIELQNQGKYENGLLSKPKNNDEKNKKVKKKTMREIFEMKSKKK